MELEIYEDDQRTGIVDVDEQTFEYDGGQSDVEDLLKQMEAGELTDLKPATTDDGGAMDRDEGSELIPGPGEAGRRQPMEEVRIGGKQLGRFLQRVIEQNNIGEGEPEIRVESDSDLSPEVITLEEGQLDDDHPSAGEGLSTEELDRKTSGWGPPSEERK
jgi:hypothetical protein